ncbi:hypothetical protein Ancab_011825 [Ancistrocladus abbreviatus]
MLILQPFFACVVGIISPWFSQSLSFQLQFNKRLVPLDPSYFFWIKICIAQPPVSEENVIAEFLVLLLGDEQALRGVFFFILLAKLLKFQRERLDFLATILDSLAVTFLFLWLCLRKLLLPKQLIVVKIFFFPN